MKFHILEDKQMRDIGFTDHVKSKWYFIKSIQPNITFNLTIHKKSLKGEIDVLDERYLQPYDYQYYMKACTRAELEFPYVTNDKVQEIMANFIEQGIITEYEMGSYI
ncbi:hypothetical protein JDW21_20310 [Bacillus subtilis]|uniref:hypothetical protein n=1 Tax=Bacillales TaxID=1385 RepID=UPI00022D8D0E|nr:MULTISPECIES: hypothetical protein [Bacillales]QMV49070.1 hypothetical protein Goe12_c01430 [Bacillus phage vB_BsuS-Goe12]AOL97857.1 hypothetical protein BS16045_02140 [Bacillus subtilis]AXF33351.1 hypothetical protein DS740_11115 [Bacillus sp. DM2]EHA30657.1 hypothetical protein BSSC8_22420 [Bacillus subtilis subsp. subtilis str. SC-8]MBG9786234.1 hypothetical protein [Brevibacillus laterosporus]